LVAENPAAQLELWEAEAAAWEAASRATALVEGGTDDPTQAAHAARDASAAWLAAAEATEKAAGQ
jgi:hypothetical protein